MKVLFISPALTHYYNIVLSRLNREPGIELTLIVPDSRSIHVGDGVHQTREGIDFKIIELKEKRFLGYYSTFGGLARTLSLEKPDIIIVSDIYLQAFFLDVRVRLAMKRIKAGLILKSIPFRYISYEDTYKKIIENTEGFAFLPDYPNRFLLTTGIIKITRKILLALKNKTLKLPDAHVNYVEAYDYWASYGIERDKIFITLNSPDTDLLFDVKDSLKNTPPILPPNPHRFLHVGRLVEWKRVDMLLRAFARVKKRFHHAELLIIGKGPEEQTLKKLAKELQLGDDVLFAGGIYDPHLLGQYFMASSLYVLAGMGGLSINDAMCFGLPVLCSVGDGTEKILVREGINGRYFREGDEDDLVEKISWFFDHPEEMKQMGQESVKIIKNDVNINTVINGYINAINYVKSQCDHRSKK